MPGMLTPKPPLICPAIFTTSYPKNCTILTGVPMMPPMMPGMPPMVAAQYPSAGATGMYPPGYPAPQVGPPQMAAAYMPPASVHGQHIPPAVSAPAPAMQHATTATPVNHPC